MIRPGDLVAVQRRSAVDVFPDDGAGPYDDAVGEVGTGDVGLVVCFSRTAWPGCLIAWGSGLLGWSDRRAIDEVPG